MYERIEGPFKYSNEEENLLETFQSIWTHSDLIGRDVATPIGIDWPKENKDLYL